MVGQVLWKSYNRKRQNFWWLSSLQWVLAIKEVPQWKMFNKLISSPITFVPAVLLLSFEEIHSCHKAYWAVRWEVSLSPSLPVIWVFTYQSFKRLRSQGSSGLALVTPQLQRSSHPLLCPSCPLLWCRWGPEQAPTSGTAAPAGRSLCSPAEPETAVETVLACSSLL